VRPCRRHISGAAIRRFQQQRFDPGVVVVDLTDAAEQVHVGGDDIIGRR
jgi:hypothetical protein